MAQSCSLYAKCVDKKTGELTSKQSLLYKALLALKKFCPSFNRNRANKLICKAQTQTYQDRFRDNLKFDQNEEPTIASLWENERSGDMSDVTIGQMRDFLADKYKEGDYDYDTAFQMMRDFNSKYEGSKTFMATIRWNPEAKKFTFQIVYNSVENQEELINTIQDVELWDTMMQKLNKLGVGVDTLSDNQTEAGLYNTYNPKTMYDPQLMQGLKGVIALRDPKSFDYKTFSNEVGHFIVGSLINSKLKGHKLVERLERLVSDPQNDDIIHDILGEDYESLMHRDNSNIEKSTLVQELMGHLIGHYLVDSAKFTYKVKPDSKGFSAKVKNFLNAAKSLISRIVDATKENFANITNGFFLSAQNQTRWTAKKLVKEFMGDNFQGTLDNALQNRQMLHSENSSVKGYIGRLIKELQLLERQLQIHDEDVAYKNLHQALGNFETEYLRIRDEAIVETNELGDMVNQVLNIFMQQLGEVYTTLSMYSDESKPIIQEDWGKLSAAIVLAHKLSDIKEKMLNDADFNTIKEMLDNQATSIGVTPEERAAINGAKSQLDSINTFTGQIEQTFNKGLEGTGLSVKTLVTALEDRVVKSFVIAVNGDDSFYIPSYRKFNSNSEEYLDSIDDILKEEHDQEEQGFMSRMLYSLGSSGDLVNQIIYMGTQMANRTANQRSVKLLQRIKELRQKFSSLTNGFNPQIFYEQIKGEDGKMHFTNNFVTNSRYGEWQRARKEAIRKAKEEFKKKHLKTDDNPTGEYATESIMWHSAEWKLELNEAQNKFHAQNSMRVYVTDHNGELVEEGFNTGVYKEAWVPYNSDPKTQEHLVPKNKLNTIANKTDYKNQDYYDMDSQLRDILDEIRSLKKELDEYLPPAMRRSYQAPSFRKNYMGAITSRLGKGDIKSAAQILFKRSYINQIAKDSSEITSNYEGNVPLLGGEYNSEDTNIFGNTQRNELKKIRKVATFGTRKLSNPDEICTDPFAALLTYGNMAYSYDALHEVANVGEVAKLQTEHRRINSSQYTSQANRNADGKHVKDSLEAFMDRNIYHVKPFQDMNYDSRKKYRLALFGMKLASAWSRTTSLVLLGGNVVSAYANLITGINMIVKEAIAGESYNKKDLVFAFTQYAIYIAESGLGLLKGVLHDFWTAADPEGKGTTPRAYTSNGGVTENITKMSLFYKYFNIGGEQEWKKYQFGRIGNQFFQMTSITDLMMLPYSLGDSIMQGMAYIAAAHHIKVDRIDSEGNRKSVSLWDAFNAKGDYLRLNTGPNDDWRYEIYDRNLANVNRLKNLKNKDSESYEPLDESGMIPLTEETIHRENNKYAVDVHGTYNPILGEHQEETDQSKLNKGIYFGDRAMTYIQTQIRGVNNRMHGIFNNQDMGMIVDMIYSPLLLTLKRYAIGLIEARWKSARYSLQDRDVVEGMYRTFGKVLWQLCILNPKKLNKENSRFKDTMAKLSNALRLSLALLDPSSLTWQAFINRPLQRLGYSKSQIANIRRIAAEYQLTALLNKLGLLFTPVPDDEPEDDDDFDILFNTHTRDFLDYAASLGIPIPDKNVDDFSAEELMDIYNKAKEAFDAKKAQERADDQDAFWHNTTEIINKLLSTHQTATTMKDVLLPWRMHDINPSKIGKSKEDPVSPTTRKILNFMTFGATAMNTQNSKPIRIIDDFLQAIGVLKSNEHGNLLGYRNKGGYYAWTKIGDEYYPVDDNGDIITDEKDVAKNQKQNVSETPFSLNGIRYLMTFRAYSEQAALANPLYIGQTIADGGVSATGTILHSIIGRFNGREGDTFDTSSDSAGTVGLYTPLGEYQSLSEITPNMALATTAIQLISFALREPPLGEVRDEYGRVVLDDNGNPVMAPQEASSQKNSYYVKQGNFSGVSRLNLALARLTPFLRSALALQYAYKSAAGKYYAQTKGLNINVNQ